MRNSRKVCIVTGGRAEYGLLYGLMKEIEVANDLELQIIATGMHLSPEFDITYLQIEKDGFTCFLIGFEALKQVLNPFRDVSDEFSCTENHL